MSSFESIDELCLALFGHFLPLFTVQYGQEVKKDVRISGDLFIDMQHGCADV